MYSAFNMLVFDTVLWAPENWSANRDLNDKFGEKLLQRVGQPGGAAKCKALWPSLLFEKLSIKEDTYKLKK